MKDIDEIRADFPILQRKIYDKPLVYLDNAATTHKPKAVLDSIVEFYTNSYGNIHRGAHYLSEQASANIKTGRIELFVELRDKHYPGSYYTLTYDSQKDNHCIQGQPRNQKNRFL